MQFTYVLQNVDYEFVIELAPLVFVPHAVHLFLEQVEHGLWNNTYIYGNTGHVMQVGPSHPGGAAMLAKEVGNVEKFRALKLDTLAFPDYSHSYPHDQWTVGFASRPGGPDWFINKVRGGERLNKHRNMSANHLIFHDCRSTTPKPMDLVVRLIMD